MYKLISDVLFILEIDKNVLSVGQLLEKGHSVMFKDKMCVIAYSNSVVLFSLEMKSKSFCLDWIEAKPNAYTCTFDQAKLWHKRMGHFHYSALDYMQKKQLVQGMAFSGMGGAVCRVC